MCRARKVGVATPTPYHVSRQHSLVFCERVEGVTLQERLAQAQGEGGAGEDAQVNAAAAGPGGWMLFPMGERRVACGRSACAG